MRASSPPHDQAPTAADTAAPLVSVIIAAFNAAAHIEETCRSALSQTHTALEVIVVDDGSTDDTAAIVERIAADDARVRLIRQVNRGVAAARNAAIEEARGDFIAPLDADDIWDERKLASQVARFRETGEATGMVYCWWAWIDIEGKVLDRSPKWEIEGRALEQLMEVNFTGNASVPLYRRTALQTVGGYDVTLRERGSQGCEDWDLALRVAERHTIAVAPAVLVGYRRHNDSMSTACETMWRSQMAVIASIAERQPSIPKSVLQRSSGQFALYLAGVSFWSGNYVQAFRWGFKARPLTLLLAVVPHVLRLLVGRVTQRFVGRRDVSLRSGKFEDGELPEPLIPYANIYREHWQAFDPETGHLRPVHLSIIGSPITQTIALLVTLMIIATKHWHNDGLWFQGDAPRHAANGLFFWDLLTSGTLHPIDYATRYYARYPVITPGAYPPLFYVIEGLAFRVVSPSPHVAKALVLAFLLLLGVYTMVWGRRWIASWAGWAGVSAMVLPGFIIYSNAVLLNVPAAAFTIAGLVHFQLWSDTGSSRHRALFLLLTTAAIVTYFPGAIVIPVAFAWMLLSPSRWRGKSLWILVACMVAIVVVVGWTMPAHLSRNAPTLSRLVSPIPWRFYAGALNRVIGIPWLTLGVIGMFAACITAKNRRAALHLLLATAAILVTLAMLPAMDGRYALVLGPLVVLGTYLGVLTYAEGLGRVRALVKGIVLLLLLIFSFRHFSGTAVPSVSGIERVAEYLKQNGAGDAVLFSGQHDGVFGFYVRAKDPAFARRVVFSTKLLYRFEQDTKFFWHETPLVHTTTDVIARVQNDCACRWVAVEREPEVWINGSERLLRDAVKSAPFEFVASFPIAAHPVRQIDVYRFTGTIGAPAGVDLQFPTFSNRHFDDVQPIAAPR